MKIVIAGSRSITSYATVKAAIMASRIWHDYGSKIVVYSGKEPKGVDRLGEEFAAKAGLKVKPFPAKWDDLKAPGAVVRTRFDGKQYNVKAGFVRNAEMADKADMALIVWDGKSPGSLDMLHQMRMRDKPVFLYPLKIAADMYDSLISKGVDIIVDEEA